MKKTKPHRIGIMTGGGDCPGLNAVIRAVTKSAMIGHGLEVFGIEDGYEGLIKKRGHMLSSQEVSGILTHGGTILGTSNTADPFKVPVQKGNQTVFEDQSAIAIHHFSDWELDGLVVVGGDGTLTIASQLSAKGVPIIGIPKTIDNDLPGTDYTFGFHTAVAIATDAVDRLHTTAAAHHRAMILEVMGRNAGWIALYAGAAGGADIILIPEIPYDFKKICMEVKHRAGIGKRFSLIVVAEGAHEINAAKILRRPDPKNPFPEKLGGVGEVLSEKIEKMGIESRSSSLGHIQRGGSPVTVDRNFGTLFGTHAVELVMKEQWGRMVCLKNDKIESVLLKDIGGIIKNVPLDHPLIKAAREVGTSFGD